MRKFAWIAVASLSLMSGLEDAQAQQKTRDQIRIVGSSTLFPFTTTVAERFGRNTADARTPIVESTGTGAGMRLFCEGVGINTPDVANASRRMTAAEFAKCQGNGVTDILEISIGFDGIVLANVADAPAYQLTRQQIFQALAKQVPVDGEIVANPYKNWQDIDPNLPDSAIAVYGPPTTSGTRDAFMELVMLPGCQAFSSLKDLSEAEQESVCLSLREDGAYIDAGENDNLIVQRLQVNKLALGIFGFSYLEQNLDVLHAATIDGVTADFDNIVDASYPVARSMYIYAKAQHFEAVPALHAFLQEYVSENAVGDMGYLLDRGLIPLLPELRSAQRSVVENREKLTLAKLDRRAASEEEADASMIE